jgi:hypothetical protein
MDHGRHESRQRGFIPSAANLALIGFLAIAEVTAATCLMWINAASAPRSQYGTKPP